MKAKRIITVAVVALTATTLSAQPKLSEKNIDEVVKAMTLDEKAALLVGDAWGTRNPTSTSDGSNYVSGAIRVPGAPFSTRPVPRFGIPSTGMSDGTAGIRFNISREGDNKKYYATSFPSSTSLASTWNAPLVYNFADVIGNEVKAYGIDVVLGPGMDIQRNPLCGRNFEYFSEDPLLTGKMTAAWVNGIQKNGVGVSAKHFAGNDQETNRFNVDARMNPRTLREITLKGFEIMVKESQPWTMMSSYNQINGKFTQQNYDLLTTILRNEWGYKGIVITDWGYKDGTVDAVKAGNDVMEAGMSFEIDRIVEAVKNGSLPIADVDRNVKRILQYIVKTQSFKSYKYSNNPDLDAHAAYVRKNAAEGMVLLKNVSDVLPLSKVKNVALFGVTSYDMAAGGTGSAHVNTRYIRNIKEGLEINGINVDSDIVDWYEKFIAFQKVNRENINSSNTELGSATIVEKDVPEEMVKKSLVDNDVAIVTIGRNAGEGCDRLLKNGDWYITNEERSMLQKVSSTYHAAGKKVIVVLNIASIIEMDSWKNLADAILLVWTPGQEAGYTIADILTGRSYPSGKLPMTIPADYFDIPSSKNFPYDYQGLNFMESDTKITDKNHKPTKNVDYTNYEEGIWVGYRYFATAKKNVSYPFGFGLGYTTFKYSNPQVRIDSDGTMTASVTVENTGKHVGKETVEIYVTAPKGGMVKPEIELKSFAKTKELKSGESQELSFTIDAYTLASFNEDASQWQTAEGNYRVYFASSSENLSISATATMPKNFSWNVHKVMLPAEKIKEIMVK